MTPAILDSPSDYTNGYHSSPLKEIREKKPVLGPHASIIVEEWAKLSANLNSNKPVHIDTEYLGVSSVAAISR